MVVAGLVVGRWWAIPLGGLAWASLLVPFGDCGWSCLPLAAVLGAANTAVGVVVHVAVGRLVGAFRAARG